MLYIFVLYYAIVERRFDNLRVDTLSCVNSERVQKGPEKHNGFWITDKEGNHKGIRDENVDKNSVMLDNECLLYVYKIALRHLLLSLKIITPQIIDNQNLVPHIVVRTGKDDPKSNYNTIENEQFIITQESISVKKKFMIIEIDKLRDLHMTMIFDKTEEMSSKINIFAAFEFVIKLLNTYPELIKKYSTLKNLLR